MHLCTVDSRYKHSSIEVPTRYTHTVFRPSYKKRPKFYPRYKHPISRPREECLYRETTVTQNRQNPTFSNQKIKHRSKLTHFYNQNPTQNLPNSKPQKLKN
jgi:hypothetical protein